MDQNEVRELLQRAEEIQLQSAVQLESRPEVQQLVLAAEEAGLDKDAVLQALRERISVAGKPVEPGDLVFAPSSDTHFYAAKVLDSDATTAKVQFLTGGEAVIDRSALRPFSIMPGQTICAPWPNWGWWNCKVVSYDSINNKVTVTDGWTQKMPFHISDVRINAEKPPLPERTKNVLTTLAFTLGGGLIGALLMRLFMR